MTTTDPHYFAIVIQGEATSRTVDIVKYCISELPKSPTTLMVVLSTWIGNPFEKYFLDLQEENPSFRYIRSNLPPGFGGIGHRHYQRWSSYFGIIEVLRHNHHISSTHRGDCKKMITHILKMRSDQLLRRPMICDFLMSQVLSYEGENRFVVGSPGTTLEECWGKFHVGDFWMFGRIENMLDWYDIKEIDTTKSWFRADVPVNSPEPDFAQMWLLKNGRNFNTFEELLSTDFIVVDGAEVELISKYHALDIPIQDLCKYWDEYGDPKTVRHSNWLKMYYKSSLPSVVIHAISFGSEGPPHDEGLPIGIPTLEEWGRLLLLGGASTYEYYTPRILAQTPADEWSVRRYPDEHAMQYNPGYHKVGLGGWRIVALRQAIEKSKDGEVVVIHCSNFHRCPDMKYFASNLSQYVNCVLKFTDFFMPPHYSTGHFTSSDVIDLIPNSEDREKIITAPMGRGRVIVARVNEKTRKFISFVERTVKNNLNLLSPIGKRGYPGYPYYHHTTAEQSVISVLAYREGFFPINWCGTWVERLRNTGGEEPGMGVDTIISYNDELNHREASPTLNELSK